MASGDQLKALLRSYIDGDDDRFLSVAVQVAAHKARMGHTKLARELRDIVDQAKARAGLAPPVAITRPRGELAGLLEVAYPRERLRDLVVHDDLSGQLKRVVREQRNAARILAQGLSPRRKLFLSGRPGTGKTLTASALAGELGLPLFQVRLDGLITKFMGETASKLRLIFDITGRTCGIYFFDEFDAIGTKRGLPGDVGEIRRIVNSFLQMIEQDCSHSLIVSATNCADIVDDAFLRRFDDVLIYRMPNPRQIATLLRRRLHDIAAPDIAWTTLADEALSLSHAEVARAADDARKDILIRNAEFATTSDVRATLQERLRVANRMEKPYVD